MKYFGWIFLFFIMVYIVPLGSRPMCLQEYRYAGPAQEILAGKPMTPPQQNMRIFTAPPMNNWLTAGSIRLFGHNAFACRLPSALAAGLMALLTSLLIHQALRDEKLAALAAVICMSGILPFAAGTTVNTDIVFAMFVVCTQGLLFLAAQEPGFNRRKQMLILLAGLSAGGAFLAKGLPAFIIPALTLAAYLLWKRKYKEFLLLPLPVLFIALLTILPWAWRVHNIDHSYWETFVLAGGTNTNCKAWWFYLPVLALGILPVGLLLPAALASGKSGWKNIFAHDLFCYTFCALIMPLIFLSILPDKSIFSIMICVPPASILIAAGVRAYFNAGGHHRAYNWVMSLWGILMLLLGAAGITGWFFREQLKQSAVAGVPLSETVLITGGTAALICGALMLYSLRGNWRGRLYLFFFGAALLPLGVFWCITPSANMPEAAFKSFTGKHLLHPARTAFFVSSNHAPALAWEFENADINIVDTAVAPPADSDKSDLSKHIAAAGLNKPVAVILPQEHAIWEKLPPPAQSSSAWGLKCYVYGTVKEK